MRQPLSKRVFSRRVRAGFFWVVAIVALAGIATGCGGSTGTTAASETTTTTAKPAAAQAEQSAPAPAKPDATATSATSSSSATKAYANDDYGFYFNYPKNWEIKTDITTQASAGGQAVYGVGAFDPEGTIANDTLLDGVVVNIYKLNINVDDSNIGDLRGEMEAMLSALESGQEGLKTVEKMTDVRVGNLPGFKVTYSFPQEGVPLVSTLYFLFQGDLEYQVILQSAEKRWDGMAPKFDAVIKSFSVKS